MNARWLFLITLAGYLSYSAYRYEPYTFALYDSGWLVHATQSIIADFDIDLKNQLGEDPRAASDQVALGLGGEWYLLHEYLLPVIGVPFYLVFGVNGCLLLNILLSTGCIMLSFAIYRCYIDKQSAALGALCMAFFTFMLNYSYEYSSDVCGAFFILLSIYFVLRKRSVLGGLLWGLAVLARIPNAFTLLAMLFLLFAGNNRVRSVFCFGVGGLPAFFVFTLSNYFMFGGPFTLSYARWAPYVEGVLVLTPQVEIFREPFFEGLMKQLFDPSAGLFMSYPLIGLALLFGAKGCWRRSHIFCCFCLLCFCSIVVPISFYPGSSGGGNRYLMTPILLLGLPLCFAIREAISPASGNDESVSR